MLGNYGYDDSYDLVGVSGCCVNVKKKFISQTNFKTKSRNLKEYKTQLTAILKVIKQLMRRG